MNTETNQFEMRPEDESDPKFIMFDIGSKVTVNGYWFEIEEINVSKNRMILRPLGRNLKVKVDKVDAF